jgi:hypothetical protein
LHKYEIMVKRKIVQEALKQTWRSVDSLGFTRGNQAYSKSGIISQLIYDIFGGEILKTHEKRGWHFYNRIDGERIDFTISEMSKFSIYNNAEDILSSPEEVHNYFEQENYFTFYMRFINAFEEIVGLKKYRHSA